MNDSRITEILKAFELFDGVYKRAEVDAALELQEEITPHLIGVLEEVLLDPSFVCCQSRLLCSHLCPYIDYSQDWRRIS